MLPAKLEAGQLAVAQVLPQKTFDRRLGLAQTLRLWANGGRPAPAGALRRV